MFYDVYLMTRLEVKTSPGFITISPVKIGVVKPKPGHALPDILNVAKKKFPKHGRNLAIQQVVE